MLFYLTTGQINRPSGTGPVLSFIQALRARLLWRLSSYLSNFSVQFFKIFARRSRDLLGVYEEAV